MVGGGEVVAVVWLRTKPTHCTHKPRPRPPPTYNPRMYEGIMGLRAPDRHGVILADEMVRGCAWVGCGSGRWGPLNQYGTPSALQPF